MSVGDLEGDFHAGADGSKAILDGGEAAEAGEPVGGLLEIVTGNGSAHMQPSGRRNLVGAITLRADDFNGGQRRRSGLRRRRLLCGRGENGESEKRKKRECAHCYRNSLVKHETGKHGLILKQIGPRGKIPSRFNPKGNSTSPERTQLRPLFCSPAGSLKGPT